MEIVEVKEIKRFFIGAIYIGKGDNGICFLLSNGKVFKYLYNNSLITIEEFTYLNQISNDFFVGPDRLYTYKNKIIGYEMPYVKGRTLNHLASNIKVKYLFNAFTILITEIEKISQKRVYLNDVHDRNIKYNNNLVIIDLDFWQDWTDKEVSDVEILNHNFKLIFQTFLRALFKVKSCFKFDFYDSEVIQLIREIYHNNYLAYNDLFNKLIDATNRDNPTIHDLRKQKIVFKYD